LRYRLFLSVVSIVALTSAFAAHAGRTTFGVKAGLHVSNASGTPEGWNESIKWKTGLTGGLFLNYALSERFSLQPELLFTQKGFGSTLIEDIVDLTVSLDYFELPVLAKYKFSPEKKFRPAIFAGPSFAYCFGSELTISTWIFSGDIDFSSLTHTTDFGIIAGGGFDYAVSGGVLILDARFSYGFTHVILSGDFEINGDTQTIDEDDFKNYGFSFMLGYAF
jgi:outer membrane protein W